MSTTSEYQQPEPKPMLQLRSRAFDRLVQSIVGVALAVVVPVWIGEGCVHSAYHMELGPDAPAGAFFLGAVVQVIFTVLGMFGVFALWKWPVRFDCPHCGKSLSSDRQWRCGRCGKENTPFVFWMETIVSRCGGCRNKPHTLQCPHCRGVADLVEDPDRRHPALFLNVEPIPAALDAAPESAGEAEARAKREQEAHEQTLRALHQQTQVIEAQVRRVMAEAKLARYAPKDETEATIGTLMKDLQGAFSRSEALLKFRKLKAEEIKTSGTHSAEEKEALIEELDELIQEAKAKYL